MSSDRCSRPYRRTVHTGDKVEFDTVDFVEFDVEGCMIFGRHSRDKNHPISKSTELNMFNFGDNVGTQ